MNHELFLTWLLNTSIMGSILAVVVLLFKKILNKKLGVRWHYLIWFIVLLRLLLPFSLETSFSFFNIANLIDQSEFGDKYITEEASDFVPITFYEESTYMWNNQELNLNNLETVDETQISNTRVKEHQEAIEGEKLSSWSGNIGLIVDKLKNLKIGQEVYFYIWLIGAFIVGSFVVASNLVFLLRIRKERIVKNNKLIDLVEDCKNIVNIKKDIQVTITRLVSIPSVCGIVKPKILIPERMYHELGDEDLKYVILHELCHLKRKDIEVNIFVEIVRAMYWFNPVIWYILGKMKQDRELACDALVLTYLDSSEHNNYGRIIIKILELLNQNRVYTPILGFLRGKNQVKRRIEMIKKFSNNKYRISLGIAILFVVVGALFLTNRLDVFDKSQVSIDTVGENNNENQQEASNINEINDANNQSSNSENNDLPSHVNAAFEALESEREASINSNENDAIDNQSVSEIKELNALAEEIAEKIKEKQIELENETDFIKVVLDHLDDDVDYVEGEMKWPVPNYYRISSPFGLRYHPVTQQKKLHTGIDIPANTGTDIIAAMDGKVVYSGYLGERGYTVILNHGDNISTVYAQASKLLVDEGDVVEAGAKIAEVGSTGASTGPHLHFEVRKNGEPVNPVEFLDEL